MSEFQPLRVLVISDQTIIRHGLASLVHAVHGMELVGEGNDLSEIGSLRQAHEPSHLPESMQAFGIASGPAIGLKQLFMSHPPLEQRIAALQRL